MIPRAKPTVYNGHRYRSRTEARWAYYFDLVNIEYIPDPQSVSIRFDDSLLGFPTNYIPDFRFPTLYSWAEVKGAVELTPTEKAKVVGLVSGSGDPCLVLQGIPQVKPYPCLMTQEWAEANGVPINKVVSDTTQHKVVMSHVMVKGSFLDWATECNCGEAMNSTGFCEECFDLEASEAVNKVAWKRDWESPEGSEETGSELSSMINW